MPTMSRVRFLLLRSVFALVLGAGPAFADAPLLPGQFQAYVEDGRMDFHLAPQVLPRFDVLFTSAGDPASLPDATLSKLASDAAIANFYFVGARVDAHRALFDELERRKAATDLEVEDFHRSLLAARRWQEAAALAVRHPQLPLEALPSRIDAGNGDDSAPNFWSFDPGNDRLVREPWPMTTGAVLVVVSHPSCGFSRAAITALENNPALARALPERRIFIAPSHGSLSLDRIGEWNAAHPGFQHVLVDRPQAWPFVHRWNTPQFFFLVDGKVVAEVEGWPDDNQTQALWAAARKAAVR